MSWNYRVVRKQKRNPVKGGKPQVLHWYDVHEVYYDKKDRVEGWTQDAIFGSFESVEELQLALISMLNDSIKCPVMEMRGTGEKKKMVSRKK